MHWKSHNKHRQLTRPKFVSLAWRYAKLTPMSTCLLQLWSFAVYRSQVCGFFFCRCWPTWVSHVLFSLGEGIDFAGFLKIPFHSPLPMKGRRGKSVRFSARPTSNLHQSQRVSFNQPSGNQINHCRGQPGVDTDFTPDQVRVCVSTVPLLLEKSPEAVNSAGWTDCK